MQNNNTIDMQSAEDAAKIALPIQIEKGVKVAGKPFDNNWAKRKTWVAGANWQQQKDKAVIRKLKYFRDTNFTENGNVTGYLHEEITKIINELENLTT